MSKENSVPGSRTGSVRRIPVRKPMPAIFAAAHKGQNAEDTPNNGLYEDVRKDKETKEKRRRGRVLVDLTKTKVNGAPRAEATTPVQERKAPLTPVVEGARQSLACGWNAMLNLPFQEGRHACFRTIHSPARQRSPRGLGR